MGKRYFTVTVDHVKLLRRANVTRHSMFGLGLDAKRPFGNSDVVGDMADIIGIERIVVDTEEAMLPRGTTEAMEKLFSELETALQIVLSTGEMKTGIYVADSEYSNDWKRA